MTAGSNLGPNGSEIAILALAGRFPGARSVADLWRNLCDGIESIRFFSPEELASAGVPADIAADPRYVPARGILDDPEWFDASFFGLAAREAEVIDPQQRILLECCWEALETAGYDSSRHPGPIGLFAGVGANQYALHLLSRRDLLSALGAFQLTIATDKDFAATRVAYKLDLTGPCVTVQTACSTSLVAVHFACQALIAGECEMALAGGASIALPQTAGYVATAGGIESPDGHCRPFDQAAAGTVGGSGAGIVLLKRLEDALRDSDPVVAVIRGTAINNDGARKIGYTAPSVEGQARALRLAHAVAEVDPATIGYFEAHGTATPLGDSIEIAALHRALAASRHEIPPGAIAIGSLKGNIGHLDTAAGIAGLTKAALALRHRRLPPSLHFERPNPKLEMAGGPLRVQSQLAEWPDGDAPRRAGVSSFGIGGTNAHAVLEECPPREPSGPSRGQQLVVLSARTPTALTRRRQDLAAHLAARPDLPLADVAWTLLAGRRPFEHRLALVASDSADAAGALADPESARVLTRGSVGAAPSLAFLFPGQGSQRAGMAADLYAGEPRFRTEVDALVEKLRPELNLDLRDLLFAPEERRAEADAALSRTEIAQPALFVVEVALARLWLHWGLRPDILLGHSLGELVAAHLADVFSLDDALRLVVARGRLVAACPPGAMLSVELPEDEAATLLGSRLSVAAQNAPRVTVLSGPVDAIDALATEVARRGIGARRLRTSHAFHSALIEPAVAPFVAAVAQATRRPPRIPIVSNATGRLLTDEEAIDPLYWGGQLLRPVRFADALHTLWAEPSRVAVEVGPGAVLTELARRHPALPRDAWVGQSLPRPGAGESDLASLLGAAGRLFLHGAEIAAARLFDGERRHRVELPTYPFERSRYYVEPPAFGLFGGPGAEKSDSPKAISPPPAPEHERPTRLATPWVAPRTPLERLIATAWTEILGIDEPGIRDDFFESGGHSLLATRLASRLRETAGADLPLGEFLNRPTIEGAAALLGNPSGESAAIVRIEPDPARQAEPFPLTEVQQAYWLGRTSDFERGGVSTHAYFETDFADLDLGRFEACLRRLVERHGMLRAVVRADGLQQILGQVPPYVVGILDLTRFVPSRAEEALLALRERMSHQVLPADRWPLFEIRATRLPNRGTRLHVSFDFLIGDAWSWRLMLNELGSSYLDPASEPPPIEISFRDYVLAEIESESQPDFARSLAHWRSRLESLPEGPELPRPRTVSEAAPARFVRREAQLAPEAWRALRARAAGHGLTPSGALIAAFSEVLAAWSRTPRFALTLTLFNRRPLHPDVNRLIGDFTSLLWLEIDQGGESPFLERALRHQRRLWEALDHRRVSSVRVRREWARERGGAAPVSTVVFTSTLDLDEGETADAEAALFGEPVYSISQTPQIELDHQVEEAHGELRYTWDTLEAAFPEGVVDAMFAAYGALLLRLVEGEAWGDYGLPTPAADLALYRSARATEAPLPPARLDELFLATVERFPDRPAIVAPDRSLSYRDLADLAALVAVRLRTLGAAPDHPIAVMLGKGWRQSVAALGILRAGACYLPIDPDLPAARIERLAKLSGFAIAVVEPGTSPPLPEGVVALEIDSLPAAPQATPGGADGDLAYVLYTSGSTGEPKGVMIEHRAAANTLLDLAARFRLGPDDRTLALSALGFDLSVFDLFGMFAVGGAAVLPERDAAREPARWIDLLNGERVTVWNSVPALSEILVDHLEQVGLRLPRHLRLILLSGDWIPVSLPDRLRRLADGPLEIVALGGATEASIWSILQPVAEVDPAWPSIPYGRPMANQTLFVFDPRLEERPLWVPGDLWIGGAGLARGYFADLERTSAAFRHHPRTGERLYRTGDLGRWLPDGTIEFLGREDGQVKIQGFRVELGEVEAHLSRQPEVAAAAAAVFGDERTGRRLLAYVVPREGSPPPDALRDRLAAALPSYMVPSAILLLDRLPLTPNGKVDRRALPNPGAAKAATPPLAATGASPIAGIVRAVTAEVLGLPSVAGDDDFFALGGQSLLATRIAVRLRQALGREVPIAFLLESPRLDDLATRIERELGLAGEAARPSLESQPRLDDEAALSFAQKRLWFLGRLAPGLSTYNLPIALAVEGELSSAALAFALGAVEERQEALRTVVRETPDGPAGRIVPPRQGRLPEVDLSGLDESVIGPLVGLLSNRAGLQPFDLATGPLLRSVMFRLAAHSLRLSFTLHHIAGDAWSMGLLVEEIAALYGEAIDGRLRPRPSLAIRYADYADWQRRDAEGERGRRSLAWWLGELGEAPAALSLPFDRPPRPLVRRGVARHRFALDSNRYEPLRGLARRTAATPFILSAALVAAWLGRLSGVDDLLLGTPVAGRDDPRLEPLIGLFVNTLALRARMAETPSLLALLGRMRATVLGAFAHREVPFDRLVDALGVERDLGRLPLVQTLFAWQNTPAPRFEIHGAKVTLLESGGDEPQFELALHAAEDGGGLRFLLETDRSLIDPATAVRWAGHLERLIEGALERPDLPLADLPILGDAERRQIAEWNATDGRFDPGDLALHRLFERQAGARPDAIALEFEDAFLSLGALEARANRLARSLRRRGVAPGGVVAVALPRSLDLPLAILAILKTGAAYLPLDPEAPPARSEAAVKDAGARFAIYSATTEALAGALPVQGIHLEREGMEITRESGDRLDADDPDQLCYVIFTSGSTGRPKGAANAHRAVVNRVLWMRDTFGIGRADRILQKTPATFDVSAWEFLLPWVSGATLVVAAPGGHRDSGYLVRTIRERQITALHFVPSMLAAFLTEPAIESCAVLGQVFLSGEALASDLVDHLARRLPCRIHNLYGPTEAAIDVSWQCARAGEPSVPIGRPIANVRLHVLDRQGGEVPIGVVGELHIGGLAVARGYAARPDLTAERFLPDPFATRPGGRLYRTGDLARWRSDGAIEYLGRADFQIKIRGVRIEPGEVEALLVAHPRIRQAVATASASPGGIRLVAYVVADPPAPSPREIETYLSAHLPAAMVPTAIVFLPALPLTASGKVDRRALPAPTAATEPAFGARRGDPIEQAIVEVWSTVLGRPAGDLPADASFFDLGGHSLLGTQILARLRRSLGVDLPLRALFDAPTIAGQTAIARAAILGGGGELVPIPRAPREGRLPLSFAQERFWVLDQIEPGSPAYNVAAAVDLIGDLPPQRLVAALHFTAARWEILRTRYPSVDGVPEQRIEPLPSWPLPTADLSALAPGLLSNEARRLATLIAGLPFDLAAAPPVRALALPLGGRVRRLVLALHHIACDAISLEILIREICDADAVPAAGRAPAAETPIQYADFAAWQRARLDEGTLAVRLEAARRRLSGASFQLELPTDRPRPARPGVRGASEPIEIGAATTDALRRLGAERGASLFMILVAALHRLLAVWSGQPGVTVGSPVSGRHHPDTEGLIGCFLNLVVLSGSAGSSGPAATVADLVRRTREEVLAALAFEDVPFERLVDALAPERNLARSPLFQVLLALQAPGRAAAGGHGFEIQPVEVDLGSARYEWSLWWTDTGSELLGAFEYATDLFDRTTARRAADQLALLLSGFAAAPEAPLSSISVLTAAERHQAICEWHGEARPTGAPAGARIAERIAAHPDRTALVFRGAAITYAELGRRSVEIAGRLTAAGARPGDRVAVLLERTPLWIETLLATWRAGAAYVPLDPSYPSERLRYMIEDSGARVLVTGGEGRARFATLQLAVVQVESRPEGFSTDRDLPAVDGDLAYVLYTSGSTGRPKGVEISHASLANFLTSMGERPGLDASDRFLAVTSQSFDIAGLELFLPLAEGAAIVLAEREDAEDGRRLAELWRRSEATVLQATPASWRLLLDADWPLGRPGRALCGGEALTPSLAAELLERASEAWNLYGPTETTIWSTAQRLGSSDTARVSVGRPIANTSAHLLSADLTPAPRGAYAELLLGGAGLARGYHGRPELTAEVFVPASDELGEPPGARLYRTGDQARRTADGRLEVAGRRDQQVKIRGHRIEPAEIEAALTACPGVGQAAVVVRGGDGPERRLVAFVEGPADLDPQAVRARLAMTLPPWLLPAEIHRLARLPRTPNEKIDRRALPESPRVPSTKRRPPQTPAAVQLAALWCELLGLDEVGLDDDFFALGGHSLNAAQLAARISNRLGRDLSVARLFEQPNLAAMARAFESAGRTSGTQVVAAPRPAAGEARFPLAPTQLGLWAHSGIEAESSAYNLAAAVRLAGSLDREALARALSRLVERHEILRTRIELSAAGPVQVVARRAALIQRTTDLGSVDRARREAALAHRLRAEALRPFDVETAPLARGLLIDLGPAEAALCLTFHHVIVDGWSLSIAVRDLAAFYAEETGQGRADLPHLPIQFADWALARREERAGSRGRAGLEYWRRRLAGVPPLLDLPADRPRSTRRTHPVGRRPVALGGELSRAVRSAARRAGTTPFVVALAGFELLAARHSGQDDFALGTVFANRSYETEDLIGPFANLVALRARLDGAAPFGEHLERVRRDLLDAAEHGDVPFGEVVDTVAAARHAGHEPLVQTVFVFHDLPEPRFVLPGIAIEPLALGSAEAKFEWNFALFDRGDEIAGTLEYESDRCDPATAERLAQGFSALLTAALDEPARPLRDLPAGSEAERHQLCTEWPDADLMPIRDTLDGRFSRWAKLKPNAEAVTSAGRSLTYAELHELSDRLASRLSRLGAGPESWVALFLRRGVDLVVALIAVLKSGAAYVPLDPDLPKERLELLVADAKASLIVTSRDLFQDLPALDARPVLIDEIPAGRPEGDSSRSASSPDHLAYLIYTSGSTGRPKGCMISHGNVLRLFSAVAERFRFGDGDVWSLFHSYGFDFSVWEIWGALLFGGRLVVVPEDTARSPEAFLDLLASERVTVLSQTPSAFRQLAAADAARPRDLALRAVIFGGEALDLSSLAAWVERHGADSPALINMYGITETTVHATYRRIEAEDLRTPDRSPIGRPLPDLSLTLLGAELRPVPVGAVGEIYLGGPGLSRGYLDRPDLTAERFVPDPSRRRAGERLYRSGDLGRYRADGQIDYLGRIDHQVKIRGYRIELGEVEAALASAPGIRAAAVAAADDGHGHSRLVGWYAPIAAAPKPADLRRRLAEILPAYMVPALLVGLERMPLTDTGKVDRKALRVPDQAGSSAAESQLPSTAAEQALARIWQQVLRVARVGRIDGFFELGGDSILAMQVSAEARRVGLGVSPRMVLEHSTLADLAAALADEQTVARSELEPQGPAPLLPMAQLFFERRLPQPDRWNQSVCLAGRLPVAAGALRRAIGTLIDRHAALRTRFQPIDGGWRQDHLPPGGPSRFSEIDLAALPRAAAAGEMARGFGAAQASLDLLRGIPFRAVRFAWGYAPEDVRLHLAAHHLAVDGVSWRILLDDLSRLVTAEDSPDLGAPPLAPAVLARRLARNAAGPALDAERSVWAPFLGASAPLAPLTDRECDAEEVDVELSSDETGRLLRTALPALRARPTEALVAAVATALARLTGASRCRLDLEGHGREEALYGGLDPTRTVGWFTALFPLEIEVGNQPAETLRRTKERIRGLPHGGAGIGLLRLSGGGPPLSPVAFNYFGQLDSALPAAAFLPAPEGPGADRDPRQPLLHPLEINASVLSERLRISWRFAPSRHRRTGIETVARTALDTLRSLLELADRRPAEALCAADFPLAPSRAVDGALLSRLAADATSIEDLYALSPSQQGLLFHAATRGAEGHYIYQLACRLDGDLAPARFGSAWSEVVRRNSILRTGFLWRNLDEPLQMVRASVGAEIERHDWSALPDEEEAIRFDAFLADDRRRGFDLLEPPLARATLVRIAERRHRLILTLHHLIIDGWSMPLLLRELFSAYSAGCGDPGRSLERTRPFRDFIAWLARRDRAAEIAFWTEELGDFAGDGELRTPAAGAQRAATLRTKLPPEVAGALRPALARERLTLATAFQGIWALALAALGDGREAIFGSVTAGRPAELSGSEKMIGMFINVIPCRPRIDETKPAAAWLAELQDRQLAARRYEHLPLYEARRLSRVAAGRPLFESTFSFNNYPVHDSLATEDPSGIAISEVRETEATAYALDLTVAAGESVALRFMYDAGRFSEDEVRRLSEGLFAALSRFAAEPSIPVGELARHLLPTPRRSAPSFGAFLAEREKRSAR